MGDTISCVWCGSEFGVFNSSQTSPARRPTCSAGCKKDERANAFNIGFTGLSTFELIEVYISQGYRCNGCGRVMDYDVMESDHIVASSVGGENGKWNIQRLCTSCNRSKGVRSMSEYMELSIPWRVEKENHWRIIDSHKVAGAILSLDAWMRGCRMYERARRLHAGTIEATAGELDAIAAHPGWLTG